MHFDISLVSSLNYIIRIIVAGVCGGVIGFERKSRLKEAGVRTHLIVAVGAALIMIVSKYGFSDLAGLRGIALDPSRVAAQIVTGIGFLGAGIIFVQNQTVVGLTTAAGVWATAGIGMCIGSGMYVIGLATTLIIVAAQTVLHMQVNWLAVPKTKQISIRVENSPDILMKLLKSLEEQKLTIINYKASEYPADCRLLQLDCAVEVGKNYDEKQLLSLMNKETSIKLLEIS